MEPITVRRESMTSSLECSMAREAPETPESPVLPERSTERTLARVRNRTDTDA